MTETMYTLVTVVHYKPTIDVELQIWEHTCIQSNNTKQPTDNWKDKLAIFMQHEAYVKLYIAILSQFKLMWDCHDSYTNIVTHCIKLLQTDTAQEHSAPYRACPETCKLEKS